MQHLMCFSLDTQEFKIKLRVHQIAFCNRTLPFPVHSSCVQQLVELEQVSSVDAQNDSVGSGDKSVSVAFSSLLEQNAALQSFTLFCYSNLRFVLSF